MALVAENLGDGGVAVVEDLFDGAADEDGSGYGAEWSKGKFVFDSVAHYGAAGGVVEFVAVVPSAIGACELDVGEGRRGFEGFDERLPSEGNFEEA